MGNFIKNHFVEHIKEDENIIDHHFHQNHLVKSTYCVFIYVVKPQGLWRDPESVRGWKNGLWGD